MIFVNNYREPIELAQGATTAALSLPDGDYRLTLTNADGNAWEIVDATVTNGAATLVRGLEGTAVQEWPGGSSIYCAVTAGQLNDLLARLNALDGGGVLPDGALTDMNGSVLTDAAGNTLITGA